MLIPGYPRGSDITIMNTFYTYPEKIDERKWSQDSITIVYKDNKTGTKRHTMIESPDHEFYTIHDNKVDTNYQPFFIDIKDCDKNAAPHNKLERELSILTDNEQFYKDNIRNNNRYNNIKLHTEPNIMFSDTNIEDHYRFRFSKEYTNSINKIYKGFFDIEVDGKYQKGDFPEPGECAINCCSYLDEKTNKVYTFILRNHDNPLIEEFEKSVGPEMFNELHDFIIEKLGGWKKATKFKLLNQDNYNLRNIDYYNLKAKHLLDITKDMQYELLFFDDEISMIKYMFDLFHHIDPDFILVWNMSFDLPYIIARCEELGYDPREIMCNKDFEKQVVKYWIDQRNKSDFAERTDYCTISGNITWLDQMIHYCSRRKSKIGSYSNFKLDTIGELESKVKKLDYHHITDSIVKLPYVDFKTFVFYNIMDVVVQKCIEEKCNDMEYIFAKAIVNNTSYRKVHRQTVYLTNRLAAEFYEDGFIIGNNCNKWNEKEEFAGALVPPVINTNGYSKINILGRDIMVANNLLDEDFKALYPSITMEHNMAPNTLIGKIILPEQVYWNENAGLLDRYDRAGEFIENFASENTIEFCHRYFHLASFKEFIMEDIPELINMGYMRSLDGRGAIYFLPNGMKKQQAISFNKNSSRNAIYFFDVEPLDFSMYRETLRQKAGL